MSESLSPGALDDDLAVTLAQTLAAANRAAGQAGVEPTDSLVTLTQISDDRLTWRIH